jgi:hypothetical protein
LRAHFFEKRALAIVLLEDVTVLSFLFWCQELVCMWRNVVGAFTILREVFAIFSFFDFLSQGLHLFDEVVTQGLAH